jgi:hypothetical protein
MHAMDDAGKARWLLELRRWLNIRLNDRRLNCDTPPGGNPLPALRAFLKIERILRRCGEDGLADFIRGVALLDATKRPCRKAKQGAPRRNLEATIKRAVKAQRIRQYVTKQRADPSVDNRSVIAKAAEKFGVSKREVERLLAEARRSANKSSADLMT